MVQSHGFYSNATQSPKGLIIPLPGFGRLASDIFNGTKIDDVALHNGYLVIAPTINQSFGWDTTAFKLITECIRAV